MLWTLTRDFKVDAAHSLSWHTGKCWRLHGHTFRISVTVRGPLKADGIVMDFADLKAAMEPLLEQLDHRNLNAVEGLSNPTAELLAEWVFLRLRLPGLVEVTVAESDDCRATYRPGR